MRKIKFRAKELYTNTWVYGHYTAGGYLRCNGELTVRHLIQSSVFHDVNPDTVGQFTGMIDRFGNEIYEDDIDLNIDEEGTEIGRVMYSEAFGKFICIYSEASGNWFDFEGTQGEFIAHSCEVIGNAHDNKELVKRRYDKERPA